MDILTQFNFEKNNIQSKLKYILFIAKTWQIDSRTMVELVEAFIKNCLDVLNLV